MFKGRITYPSKGRRLRSSKSRAGYLGKNLLKNHWTGETVTCMEGFLYIDTNLCKPWHRKSWSGCRIFFKILYRNTQKNSLISSHEPQKFNCNYNLTLCNSFSFAAKVQYVKLICIAKYIYAVFIEQ